jgi:hypothetical protein
VLPAHCVVTVVSCSSARCNRLGINALPAFDGLEVVLVHHIESEDGVIRLDVVDQRIDTRFLA